MNLDVSRPIHTALVAILTAGYLLCSTQAFTSNAILSQTLHASSTTTILKVAEKFEVENGVNGRAENDGRFGNLLDSVGLSGKLKHAQDLDSIRTITPNDVFCNRELKMSGIRAIGVSCVNAAKGRATLHHLTFIFLFLSILECDSLIWITPWYVRAWDLCCLSSGRISLTSLPPWRFIL